MSQRRGEEIELGDVAAILFDEFGRSSTMYAKTFHKTTYFIEKRIQELGGDFDLPYFWYKFGTMTVTENSPVTIQYSGDESEVLCSRRTGDLTLSEEQEDIIRTATKQVLKEHDDIETEGLTDRMYEEDAPYEAQRKYRQLDDFVQWQLYKEDEEETDFERAEVRRYINEFIDSFPEHEFPEYENDLFLWYDLLSNRLTDQSTTLGEIEDLVELFWSLFSIELAVTIDTGPSVQTIKRELGIGDLRKRQQYFRNELRQKEREHLYIEEESDHLIEAADTVVASELDFVEISRA